MPINSPPQWTIDGLVLNGPRDSDGVQWIATADSDPLSAAAPTSVYTPKFQRHGSYRVPGFVERGVSNFTIRAYARRDDWAALRRASLRMLALCQDVTRLYPLVFQSEVGNLVQYVAREGDILIKHVQAQDPAIEASVQFTSPDPRRYDVDWTVLVTGVSQPSATGLNFDGGGASTGLNFDGAGAGTGLDFGTQSGSGSVVLDNTRGTAPSTPRLTLSGPLTTPVLTTALGSIQYNATLSATDLVEIRPEDPSVLLGGTASRGYLANPAQWSGFSVAPGTRLTVGLTHSGPSTDLGTLTARFRSAYW